MSSIGWEALPNVREWSGSPPGCLQMVEMHSRLSVMGRKAIPDVREWSGGLLGCP